MSENIQFIHDRSKFQSEVCIATMYVCTYVCASFRDDGIVRQTQIEFSFAPYGNSLHDYLHI